MVDYSKYNLSEDNMQFIKDLHDIEEGQSEAALIYKNTLHFDVEMMCGKVYVFFSDENFFTFDTMDDMILNFKLDGKPFIEVIEDIDFN